jgi:glycosyltransferase involved in cell wall biosynthesis
MKKKLVFAHDHIFTEKHGRIYSAAAFPSDSWDRYLDFFDSVDVVGRCSGHEQDVCGLVVSSTENVNFHFVRTEKFSLSGFFVRRRDAKRIISKLLESSSAVVARLPSKNGNVAIELARKKGIPVAVEVVGCAFDAYYNYGSLAAKIYAPIAYYKMRRSVKNASQALFVTSKYLQRKYPIEDGVFNVSASNVNISERFYKDPDDVSEMIRFDDQIVIGLIGNFKTNYKGIDVAIKALAYLRKVGLDASLKILGAGEKLEYEALAQDLSVRENVVFCGSLPNGGPVIDWIDSVDLYIQPSRTEGLPRSLIEAMSQGKPCFGSNVGGTPELLAGEYIHQACDFVGLANQILDSIKEGRLKKFDVENYRRSLEFSHDKLKLKRSVFFQRLYNLS